MGCNDPPFCNLRNPGEPIKNMSRTAGQVVKSLMADLGHDPDHYAAHSLRKTRTTHVLNTGGNTLEDMKHAGRRSEAAGLPYVHRSPRNPVAADPMREVFDDVRQNESSDMHNVTDPPPAPVSTDSEPAVIAQPPALVSGGREPPPPALLEPYVTVSRHTAPTVRRSSASVDLSVPPPKG